MTPLERAGAVLTKHGWRLTLRVRSESTGTQAGAFYVHPTDLGVRIHIAEDGGMVYLLRRSSDGAWVRSRVQPTDQDGKHGLPAIPEPGDFGQPAAWQKENP